VSSRRGWVLGTAVVSFAFAVVAIGVAVKWVNTPQRSGVPLAHHPQTKGVVSGTLVLVGAPADGVAPVMTPVPGRVSLANVYQIGPTTSVALVGHNGTFSISVDPGLYQVVGTTPRTSVGDMCVIPGQTLRVRAGDHLNVTVACRIK